MEYFINLANWFTYLIAYAAPVVGFGGIVFAIRSYIHLLSGGAGTPSTERKSEIVYTAALNFFTFNARLSIWLAIGIIIVLIFAGVGLSGCLLFIGGVIAALLLAFGSLLVTIASVSRFVTPRKEGMIAEAFQRAFGGSMTVAVLTGGVFLFCVGLGFYFWGSNGEMLRGLYLVFGMAIVACLLRISGEHVIGHTTRHYLSKLGKEESAISSAIRTNPPTLDIGDALLSFAVSASVRSVIVAVEILVLLVATTVAVMAVLSRVSITQDHPLFIFFMEGRDASFLHALVAAPLALALFYYFALFLGLNAPTRVNDGGAWSSLRSLGTMTSGVFLGGSLFFMLFSGLRLSIWASLSLGVVLSIVMLVLNEFNSYQTSFLQTGSLGRSDEEEISATALFRENIFAHWTTVLASCMKSAASQLFAIAVCAILGGILAGVTGIAFTILGCLLFALNLLVVSCYGGIVRAGSCVASLPEDSGEYQPTKVEKSSADSLEVLVRGVLESYWGITLVALILAMVVNIEWFVKNGIVGDPLLLRFDLQWHYAIACYLLGLAGGLGICGVPLYLSSGTKVIGFEEEETIGADHQTSHVLPKSDFIEGRIYIPGMQIALLCALIALFAGFFVRLLLGVVALCGFVLGALSAGWVITLLSTHLFSRIAHLGWVSKPSEVSAPSTPSTVPASSKFQSLVMLGGEGLFSPLATPTIYMAFLSAILGLLGWL